MSPRRAVDPARRRYARARRLLPWLLVLLLVPAIAGALFLATLPDVGDAEARVAAVLRAHRGPDTGLPVPSRIGRAIVAVEDERFYGHHGVDITGLVRAMRADLAQGAARQGGSTITQQLAKALYVRDDHSPGAKLRMIGMALKLERRYTKARILEMYLNVIYFGDGQWGVARASRAYFGKAPGHLDWAEASLLAGLPQAPSAYDPVRHFALARARQRHVLDTLVRAGLLSAPAARATYAELATLRD